MRTDDQQQVFVDSVPSTRVLLRIVHLNHSLVTIDVPQGDFMGVALKAGFIIAVALALAIFAGFVTYDQVVWAIDGLRQAAHF